MASLLAWEEEWEGACAAESEVACVVGWVAALAAALEEAWAEESVGSLLGKQCWAVLLGNPNQPSRSNTRSSPRSKTSRFPLGSRKVPTWMWCERTTTREEGEAAAS